MKKTRFLSLALTGTLCVSLLAGCGGSGDGGGAAQTPDAANTSAVQENTGSAFKLGGTGPLTGDAAIYGLAAQRGAQIAVDEIKEAGGDIQFALKYEDDVNVPETAVNAYNALKEWGMQISLGSVTSQPGVSTSALAFEDRIFTMTPSGSSPDVISGKDNVYQMCFSDPNQGLASAQYITEQGLGEKVFIIWKNDDVYSTGIKEQFVKEAETLGLEVVGDATDEATVNFVTKYQELYGETPNQFAADAYDCVYAYKMALEAAGCTPDMSNEELCDALIATFPTITLTGLTGDGAGITWDASGEVSKSPKGIVIENGAYVGMD